MMQIAKSAALLGTAAGIVMLGAQNAEASGLQPSDGSAVSQALNFNEVFGRGDGRDTQVNVEEQAQATTINNTVVNRNDNAARASSTNTAAVAVGNLLFMAGP